MAKIDIFAIDLGDTIHWRDTVVTGHLEKVITKKTVVTGIMPCLDETKLLFFVLGERGGIRGERVTKVIPKTKKQKSSNE